MSEHMLYYPDGGPTDFQSSAVDALTSILQTHGIPCTAFTLNVGAKRGFCATFVLDGVEHVLCVYPDELNIIGGDRLYENYLRHEFANKETMLASFGRRLTRLLREGIWALPEES